MKDFIIKSIFVANNKLYVPISQDSKEKEVTQQLKYTKYGLDEAEKSTDETIIRAWKFLEVIHALNEHGLIPVNRSVNYPIYRRFASEEHEHFVESLSDTLDGGDGDDIDEERTDEAEYRLVRYGEYTFLSEHLLNPSLPPVTAWNYSC